MIIVTQLNNKFRLIDFHFDFISKVCIAVAALIVITITPIEADRELNFHCTDYIREMLQDGCMHLQRYLRQKMDSKMKLDESKKKSNVGRSKRDMDNLTEYSNEAENEMDTEIFNFRLQYVKNECKYQYALHNFAIYNLLVVQKLFNFYLPNKCGLTH